MAHYARALSLVALAGVGGCGAVYVARDAYWRPVMPSVVIDATGVEALVGSPQLLLIYDERGGDPLRSGPLAPGQRLSSCDVAGDACVSFAARHEFRLDGADRQSLQIRRINGHGNPIVATLVWRGPAYPSAINLTCDFRTAAVGKVCAIRGMKS